MTEQELIPAKATSLAEQSDSIVVSFGAEWHEHLLARKFSIVIRKRIPKHGSFRWLYFHINNPVSAICARAPIEKIFTATTQEAVALAKKIHLAPAEITAYIGAGSGIGSYQIGDIQMALKPVTTADLASRMIYHPPQSFFIMSKEAKAIMDDMTGFASRTKSGSARKQTK